MIEIILSAIVLAIVGGVFLLAHMKSKGAYDDYMDAVDQKEYSLKDIIPAGLYINERIKLQRILPMALYQRLHKYDLNIKGQILEIYGLKYADFYMMIHCANRTATSLAASMGAAFFALLAAGRGDPDNSRLFIVISLASLIGVQLLVDNDLKEKIAKRHLAIQRDFPDFINKLTLLVNAGMTLSRALEKIINDNKKTTPLYNELTYAMSEIRAGKPEAIAYEEFGRRCKIKEVIRFVSVVIQNLKKGGAEVVPVLRVQAMECWELRKNVAKQLGEQASTKILLPLIIMFIGILIIVITPALMGFMMA